MAAGVRVLGAEGRAEGVDLGECQAVGLDVELSRHRQERLAAKEILREIDLALWGARQIGEIQARHPEQCPGPPASEAVITGVLTQKTVSCRCRANAGLPEPNCDLDHFTHFQT